MCGRRCQMRACSFGDDQNSHGCPQWRCFWPSEADSQLDPFVLVCLGLVLVKADVFATLLAPSHSCSSGYAADEGYWLQSTLIVSTSRDILLRSRRVFLDLTRSQSCLLIEDLGCTWSGLTDVLNCLYLPRLSDAHPFCAVSNYSLISAKMWVLPRFKGF